MRPALQLYTVREFLKTGASFESALRRARELGFEGVQLSAVECMNGDRPLVDAKTARRMLDDLGLECCATHRPLERLESRLDDELEFHTLLRCAFAAISSPPDWAKNGGLDGYRKLADALNVISEKSNPNGVRIGYHNHALEFERLGINGERPFDILVQRCERDVYFLLDTYWVVHAGIDLIALITSLQGRIPVVHLKDKAVFGWDVDFAPIGEGNLPWDKVFPALKTAGTQWAAVEQDTCRRDVWDCVATSAAFLSHALGMLRDN